MIRQLDKAIKGATRRVFTSKNGNKNYYKGKGTGAMGQHTRHADYIVDYSRIRQFVVPSLVGFSLGPYLDARCLPEDLNAKDFPVTPLTPMQFKALAEKAGNAFDVTRAEPLDTLVNPPEHSPYTQEDFKPLPVPEKLISDQV